MLIGDYFIPLYRLLLMLREPHLTKLHASDFKPSVADLNSLSRKGRRAVGSDVVRFNFFGRKLRQQVASPEFLAPDVAEMTRQLRTQLEARLKENGPSSRQLATIPLLMAVALHPACKGFIFDKSRTLFTPTQKAAAQAQLRALLARVVLPLEEAAAAANASGGVAGDSPGRAAKRARFYIPGVSAAPPPLVPKDELSIWADIPEEQMSAAERWNPELKLLKSTMPRLRVVARAVFGVDGDSCGCESDFSEAANILQPKRRAMKTGTFATLMYLKVNKDLWCANEDLEGNPEWCNVAAAARAEMEAQQAAGGSDDDDECGDDE